VTLSLIRFSDINSDTLHLTLKIGGSKAYERYRVPTAGGMLAVVTVGSFLAYIVGMIKFFVPF